MIQNEKKETLISADVSGRISHLSPDVQLLVWLGLFLGMFFVAQLVSGIIILAYYQTMDLAGIAKDPTDLNTLRFAQILATLFGFLLPAILFHRLKYGKSTGFNMGKSSFSVYLLLLVPAMLYTLYAVIDVSFFVNKWMPWNGWMKDSQEQYKVVVDALMADTSLSVLLLNIITVALVPAISEELLFRGSMQRFLTERMNVHVAIVLSAIFFSLIHFEFSGFLPRIILGMFLGYLFYYTGNIWVSIFAHLVNNGVQVIFMYLDKTGIYKINVDDPVMPSAIELVLYTTAFAILWAILYHFIRKEKMSNFV